MRDSTRPSGIRAGVLLPALLVTALFSVGCDSPPPALTVGPVSFTEDELLGLSRELRVTLARITAFGLAVSRGEESTMAAPLLERGEEALLVDRLRKEIRLQVAGVTDEILEARYLSNPRYELEVRHLVLLSERTDPEEEREAARETATAALARARAEEPFPELTAEYSEEPGAAERGGLLRPGREGSWVPEFWAAASSLQPGELSGVVETEYGFHVLKLENRTVVPFPEARHRVVDEVAALIPGVDAQVTAWIDSVSASLSVDNDGLDAWLGGTADDEIRLAGWSEGVYPAGAFRRYLTGQEDARRRAITNADRTELESFVMEAARGALLGGLAQALGITVPDDERAELERGWRDTSLRWAAAFGFSPEMSPQAVKARSLEGLSSSRQSALIARDEVMDRSPMIAAAYPVVMATEGGAGSP